MYCSGCGGPIAPGLSFCNRCGMSLKSSSDSKQTGVISAVVTAMTLIAVAGMGMMLGGAIALKRGGQFDEDVIALFMFLSFFIVAFTEIFLYRQLGRVTTTGENKQFLDPANQSAMPTEFRVPQPRALAEPIPSVTENTTRTLEYSREERLR
jgi:hypothetical protein